MRLWWPHLTPGDRGRENRMRPSRIGGILLSGVAVLSLVFIFGENKVVFLFAGTHVSEIQSAGTQAGSGKATPAKGGDAKIDGGKFFKGNCADCHKIDSIIDAKGAILDSMNSGSMKGVRSQLSAAEKQAVAEYIVASRTAGAAAAAQPSKSAPDAEPKTGTEPKTAPPAAKSDEAEGKAAQGQGKISKSDAEKLYNDNCAQCHENGSLAATKDAILASMNSGSMRRQSAALRDAEELAVAEYIVASHAAATAPAKADSQSKPEKSSEPKE